MKPNKDQTTIEPSSFSRATWFALLAGVFFFVVVIKLGDPIIIPNESMAPSSLLEAALQPWPTSWGYWVLAPMFILGLPLAPWKEMKFRPVLLFPLGWLFWQFVAGAHTVDPELTRLTLRHFTACAVLFYLGFLGLNNVRWPWPLFVGLALALCWVIRSGFEQHFGGLAATRDYVMKMYGSGWPDMAARNPDFAKRMESNRIFATFVYPNALAGGILLLLPMTLVFVWQLTPKVSLPIRRLFVGILGACGFAILFWSGSKAGWLLAAVMVLIAGITTFRNRISTKMLVGLAAAFLALALVGFAVRFSHYFARGATSVSARFDYWKAACQVIEAHPLVGTGPGTFSRPYARLKTPQAEMTRLTHNDYLEQGSDSGIPGLVLYISFIAMALFQLYRYRIAKNSGKFPIIDAVSLGVLGLCLHSFVEYHLYIPALAWPLFFLLGWLTSLRE